MPIRLEFNLGTGPQPTSQRRDPGRPMRILMLGDFGSSARAPWARRALPAVDLDSFGPVMARLAPSLHLPPDVAGDDATPVTFESLDDFHPDALFQRLPHLQPLRDLRRRLSDDHHYAAAMAELQAAGVITAPASSAADATAAPRPESDRDTIARLLGRAPASGSPAGDAIEAMVKRIVAPHVITDAAPRRDEATAALDALIGEAMRQVLHTPAFQSLEMAWRGLHLLTTRLELDETLQLHLLDVTRDELAADLLAVDGDLARSALLRRLRETGADAPDGEPWSMLISPIAFGPGDADLALLAALGALAAATGAPLIANAAPALYGCAGPHQLPKPATWAPLSAEHAAGLAALRRSALARWIGLAAPRVLLRLPYGAETDPIESFSFEEQAGGRPEHESLAWAPGSLAVALRVGEVFRDGGWDDVPGGGGDVADLPAYVYEHEGEKHLQPCAEAAIGERAGDSMLALGLMPLLSHRHRAAVRVLRVQSIAEPARPLSFG